MARFAFVLKQFRLEDEGLKPRRGQSITYVYIMSMLIITCQHHVSLHDRISYLQHQIQIRGACAGPER